MDKTDDLPTDAPSDTPNTLDHLKDKEYCRSCGKPLGATRPTCFECGGTSDRGERITNREWRVYLGV
jgi:hypothetical protein